MTRDEFKGLVDDLMTAVGACEQATDDTAQREVAVAGDALLAAFDAQAAEVERFRALESGWAEGARMASARADAAESLLAEAVGVIEEMVAILDLTSIAMTPDTKRSVRAVHSARGFLYRRRAG